MTQAKTKKFFEYFELPKYDEIDRKESRLERSVQNANEKVTGLQSLDDVKTLIDKTCQSVSKYFDFARSWIDEQSKTTKVQDSEEGREIKQKTLNLLSHYEPKIQEFIATDIMVRHYIQIVKEFLAREEEEMDVIPKVEWDKDTQTFIEQHLKKMPKLKKEISRLKDAMSLLDGLGKQLDDLESGLISVFGKDIGTKIFRSYMTGLRNMNLDKADAAIKHMKNSKAKFKLIPGKAGKKDILRSAEKLKNEYLENSDVLKLADDRIFLKKSEASISLDVSKKEHKQAADLINKYHHSYLKNRVITLTKLHERLYHTSDLQGLLRLYRMAVKGMLVSVKRFEDVRMFDSCVTGQLDYLINEKLNDLQYVKSRSEDVMNDFQRAVQNRLEQKA